MIAAIKKVEEGLGLREASRQCNVPVETLRRRVVGAVGVDCKPGPPTVLTAEGEQKLVDCLIEMSEIGFGLTRQDVSCFQVREALEAIERGSGARMV